MGKIKFWKIFFSPFVNPKVVCYFGKTKIPVPYFLPRRWVKHSEEEVDKMVQEKLQKGSCIPKGELRKVFSKRLKPVTKKFGFDCVDLGWKWKYDFLRFEHSPVISFVCFGYQLAFSFRHEHEVHLWEMWLNYEIKTDKTKSAKERLEECRKIYPCIWVGNNGKTDYYELCVKQ